MYVAHQGVALALEGGQPFRFVAEAVPGQFGVLDTVDPHVDHHRPGLDEFAGDHRRPAQGGHQNVRLGGHGRQVNGAGMADGHRGIGVLEQEGHGAADDVGTAQYHRATPLHRNAAAPQEFHDPRRRAGDEPLAPQTEIAHVHRVETVHVLVRVDGPDYPVGVHPGGQGQLDQNAVDVASPVGEVQHRVKHRLLRGVGGQAQGLGVDARLGTGLLLVADIDRRGRIVAHQHHPQAGNSAAGFPQPVHLRPDLLADLAGDQLAIQDLCRHVSPLSVQ